MRVWPPVSTSRAPRRGSHSSKLDCRVRKQIQRKRACVRGQVEEDVRLAYAALRTTADTVRAADQAVTLAERELEMARDRFRAGVGDSIELVTAQTTLANARSDQVTALAVYNGAR